jgi:hypothetical protein
MSGVGFEPGSAESEHASTACHRPRGHCRRLSGTESGTRTSCSHILAVPLTAGTGSFLRSCSPFLLSHLPPCRSSVLSGARVVGRYGDSFRAARPKESVFDSRQLQQTGSVVHPALCAVGTGEWTSQVKLTADLHPLPRLKLIKPCLHSAIHLHGVVKESCCPCAQLIEDLKMQLVTSIVRGKTVSQAVLAVCCLLLTLRL